MGIKSTTKYLYSLIPYADITSAQESNSTYGDKDRMPRTQRKSALIEVKYTEANKGSYSEYEQSEIPLRLNDTKFDDTYNSISLKSSDLTITNDLGLEIGYVEIATAGGSYSAGTLTATGGGGTGFSGSYTVDSGAINTVTILNRGEGYTSVPTIVISDSGDSTAVLTPHLLQPLNSLDLATNNKENPCYTLVLKDDLTYASSLTIDKNTSGDDAENAKGLYVDFDRTVASSGTAAHNDIGIDLDVNSASLGTSSAIGIDIDIVGATSGTHSATGIDINVSGADKNYGMDITSSDYQLKLIASADSDDYATFTLADTGDLTIATVGDGTTDSDLTLDADGDIILEAAGANINADAPITVTNTTSPQLTLKYGLTNKIIFGVASNGTTTLTTSGAGATASDLILDVDGDIVLDSANGIFIAKNNGTEFSPANSSYAGMILGYRDIGLNEAAASYNLTTSYVVPTDEFGVTFTAPPSGNVEIYIQIQSDMGSSAAGDLHVGLSTANATSGYSALASYHEVELRDGVARGSITTSTHSWTLTGLTAGTSYTYYVGFKSTSTTGTPHLQWGGDASNTIPDFIMKATALPSTILT